MSESIPDFHQFPGIFDRDAVLDEPKFLLTDVAVVTGISTNVLKSWLSREPIAVQLGPYDRQAMGKGSSRVFTLRRVLSIALAAELIRLGIAPSRSGFMAQWYTDRRIKKEDSWEQRENQLLVAHSSSDPSLLFSFITDKSGIIDLFEHPETGQTLKSCVVVNFKQIKADVIEGLKSRGKLP